MDLALALLSKPAFEDTDLVVPAHFLGANSDYTDSSNNSIRTLNSRIQRHQYHALKRSTSSLPKYAQKSFSAECTILFELSLNEIVLPSKSNTRTRPFFRPTQCQIQRQPQPAINNPSPAFIPKQKNPRLQTLTVPILTKRNSTPESQPYLSHHSKQPKPYDATTLALASGRRVRVGSQSIYSYQNM